MADLSTTYMGLTLRNPLIIASCGYTDSVAEIKKLEKHGAGAVVLKSLFEEQILMDVDEQRVNNIYGTYSDVENYVSFYTRKRQLDDYLALIRESKEKTSIPIIASINCISDSQWVEFAGKIQEAGADGLELNMFIMPSDEQFTGTEIEQIYFDVVKKVKEQTTLPVALKISYFFSGMANFTLRLSQSGISALVLFNRFFSPDIDLDTEKVIYKKGIPVVGTILNEIGHWMDTKGYKSMDEIIGRMAQKNLSRPMVYERAQFMKYFADS